jgi:ElaB/YqjD/DUF883 family membrane-anchored ribosome-binding protein
MDQEPDVIRQKIENTRESLAGKLETLEGQVKGTVEAVSNTIGSVKEKVESTVENVKSTVSDTVDSVKETFDLSRQVDRHPWAAAGCSLLAGLATGYLVSGPRRWRHYASEFSDTASHLASRASEAVGYGAAGAGLSGAAAESLRGDRGPRRGVLGGLLEPFAGELDNLKDLAVGALMGVARDFIVRSVPPSLAPRVEEILNNATRRAGAEPVSGPVLQTEGTGDGGGRGSRYPA